jgi:hypothetical protein
VGLLVGSGLSLMCHCVTATKETHKEAKVLACREHKANQQRALKKGELLIAPKIDLTVHRAAFLQ